MIAFLLALHDDELFSSLLMRLFEEGAYIYPKNFLSEILDGKQRFNYLYVNRLKPELIDLLDKTYGWKNIIQNHTLEGWDNLFGNFSGTSPTNSFVRYCPMCLKEKKYIQLLPQIKELNYCPFHGYRYIDSRISLNRTINYLIKPISDFTHQNYEMIRSVNLEDINVKVSNYINQVINASRNGFKPAKTNDYLRMYIPKEYFYTKTRAKVNSSKIKQSLDNFYRGLEGYELNERQIKRIMSGESINPFYICLFAFWLGIKSDELVIRKEKTEASIDETVNSLKQCGYSERQISVIVGISKTAVHKRLLNVKEHLKN